MEQLEEITAEQLINTILSIQAENESVENLISMLQNLAISYSEKVANDDVDLEDDTKKQVKRKVMARTTPICLTANKIEQCLLGMVTIYHNLDVISGLFDKVCDELLNVDHETVLELNRMAEEQDRSLNELYTEYKKGNIEIPDMDKNEIVDESEEEGSIDIETSDTLVDATEKFQ